jgi:hypothetical protein
MPNLSIENEGSAAKDTKRHQEAMLKIWSLSLPHVTPMLHFRISLHVNSGIDVGNLDYEGTYA